MLLLLAFLTTPLLSLQQSPHGATPNQPRVQRSATLGNQRPSQQQSPSVERSAKKPPSQAIPSRDALLQAATFLRQEVAASGGYAWKYSADLSLREGEVASISPTTVWVQPPGTPAMGEAFLYAYQLTGEQALLDAALETAEALVLGQLKSGGWDYRIEMAAMDRLRYAYRVDAMDAPDERTTRGKKRNTTTLDDNTTQSALRFLMHVDLETKFAHERIHSAVLFALDRLIEAQWANGAWPQRFDEQHDPAANAERLATLKASYPDGWSRTYPKLDYRGYFTFNDNAMADMITTMCEAELIYEHKQAGEAARKAGKFILLAQLPDPQPAWAQQYNPDMQPAWARKFEPPAVSGGESQGVIQVLLQLYDHTGDEALLDSAAKALTYLQSSLRPDGAVARFYELKTNKPLYFTKSYELTYSDDDMPTHYAFVVSSRLGRLQRRLEQLRQSGATHRAFAVTRPKPRRASAALDARAAQVRQAMDARGALLSQGSLLDKGDEKVPLLDTRQVARDLRTLAEHASANTD